MKLRYINLDVHVVVTKILCVFKNDGRLFEEIVMTSSFDLVVNLATHTKNVVTKGIL